MKSELSKAAIRQIKEAATNIKHFAMWLIGITLRPYQLKAAQAVIDSVFARDGMTFIWIFSRQSGKDETIAIMLLFLMLRFADWGAEMICAQPTFKPQTINALERLKSRSTNFGRRIRRTAGYIVRLAAARVSYFSTEPSANVVGATADRLLIGNEAQDIEIAVWDKRFSPMAASGNATKLFSGTRWTSDTLLERELKLALEAEKKDGIRRVFMVDADEVAQSNRLYGQFVKGEVKKLGRQHPLIKTQFYNEVIDAQAGMFTDRRRALMLGDQPAQDAPIPGHLYALLIDVGGQDEALLNLDGMGNTGRDYVTLNIVDVDLSSLQLLQAPTYRVVKRLEWQGDNHVNIFGSIKAIMDAWRAQYIVIDATGVGEGLWGMCAKKYPSKTIPVKFTQQTKSEIGYGYIAVIETGRFRDCAPSETVAMQYKYCKSEILPGPAKTLRWGVKDGTRGPDGLLIHDDYILADSLTSELDKLEWYVASETTVIEAQDPLQDMDNAY